MTPELLHDIRVCARAVGYAFPYGQDPEERGAAWRVLGWLDDYERLHTPIMLWMIPKLTPSTLGSTLPAAYSI